MKFLGKTYLMIILKFTKDLSLKDTFFEESHAGNQIDLPLAVSGLKDCKKRRNNLSVAWIDYREAYDLVSHRWVNEWIEMFAIA